MRMTTIHAESERKRQDRSVYRAEKRLCRARMLRVRGLIHPTSTVCATTDTARSEKRLNSEQNQAILKSSGGPLGECRIGNHQMKGQSEHRRNIMGVQPTALPFAEPQHEEISKDLLVRDDARQDGDQHEHRGGTEIGRAHV